MKIEIELQEVERLRTQVLEQDAEIQELREKLSEINEGELKQRAIKLSKRLLDGYLATVFEKLGFDIKSDGNVIYDDYLEHYLGREWWKSDRIKVGVGANICHEFRRAYLKIGVLPKEEIEKKETDTFDLK